MHDARAAADSTRSLVFAGAAAARTRRVELHAPSGLRDCAFTAALGARARRFQMSTAVAVRANILARHIELQHAAANRRPEGDVDLVLDVGPRFGTRGRRARAAAAEDR